jgi:hypothetical protein
MKIALVTLGTRGDDQPYAFFEKGAKPLWTHSNFNNCQKFEELVKSYSMTAKG